MIVLLDKNVIGFPDPRKGDEDGFFAVGGDLSAERLLLAYSHGIFPWYAFRKEDADMSLIDPETDQPYIQWWCPMKRFVIFPDELHISHSMRQMINRLNRGELRITYNAAFDEVIDHCSFADGRMDYEGAWLGDDMKAAYRQLNRMGFAFSTEVWEGDRLCGGLYGVTIGNGFFGESMFSLIPSGSKLALYGLSALAQKVGLRLIDCQFRTPHLESMGGRYIDYDEYLSLIK